MATTLKKLFLYFLCIICIAGFTMYVLNQTSSASDTPTESITLSKGTVTTIANVSGKTEATDDAALGFPQAGVVREIMKKEGESVIKGEIIASLTQDAFVAEYNAALYDLAYQNATKRELVRGPQEEAREITNVNVQIAEQNLERITQEQKILVQGAYEVLMSSELEALPVSKLNNDTPPTISGNYRCANEGSYTFSLYKSNSPTGYTCNFSGLESGTLPSYEDTPVSLGTCGLYIQFDSTEWYKNEDWVIEIPNKRGSSYIENLNAYTLALKEQEHTIALATQELDLVRKTAGLENAVPTHEAREQADARIAQAAAIVSAKEAHIADRVIKAPFDGVITDISMKVGEVSDNTKTITLIQNGSYVFKARIPEVDIRKIAVGNTATVLFDAAPNEPIPALIEYISPTSIEIDGVAYYEARLKLSYVPIWIREGLNADVDIVVEKRDQVLVLPKRFIIQEGDTYYAHVLHDVRPVKTELRTGLVGNDGFVEVQNISEGATVVIP